MNDNKSKTVTPLINAHVQPQLYKKRWFMLAIYFVIVPASTLQWGQFTIIANIIVDYYNVSYEAVNWTGMVPLLLFGIFLFPASYVVDKYGLRIGVLSGILGTCLATWIKVGSVSPNRFWLIIVAQAIVSVPQISLLVAGPKLSAHWFGSNEVALANSIGIIATQMGMALGFLLPPMLVKKETVEQDLFVTNLGLAIICTLMSIVVFIFFLDKPPIHPSYAALQSDKPIEYIKTTLELLKNIPFVFTIVQVGCNIGVFCTIQTMLNQMILMHYPNGEEDAGRMGLLMMLLCTIGCFISGIILSKFKIYRLCLWVSLLLLVITLIAFNYTLEINIAFPYITCSIFGLFYGQFWASCYEIAIELSYPEPEGIVIGLLNGLGQVMAVAFTYFYSFLFYDVKGVWVNMFFPLISILSFVMALCIKYEFKREAANLKGNAEDILLEIPLK